jgi:nucleoside-diphosphate-sugar epimerase
MAARQHNMVWNEWGTFVSVPVMRVLIVGAGYVGLPLGAELVRLGHEVFGMRRRAGGEPELKTAGICPVMADVSKASDLERLPGSFDWVVNCVSSDKGGAEEYRKVYLEGNRNLLQWLNPSPPKKFVYTSSTSVYGQTDGSAVQEASPTEPASETSRILVETEQVVLNAAKQFGFPAVVLRVAGIYGPDRGHLFLQYLRNEARIDGSGDRIINMIHRDDVVGVVIQALKAGQMGEIYNAVDDEPVAQIRFLRWLAETLRKPMPAFASGPESPVRKRGTTHKRVQNDKLKTELGYHFKYPNFREGYRAEIQRLAQLGELDNLHAPDSR